MLPGLCLVGGSTEDPALIASGRTVTYGELRGLVDERRTHLGAERRLVVITAGNAIEPVVTYLAALEAGHPVLFVPDDGSAGAAHREALIERFDPDVVAAGASEGWRLQERRAGSRHDLHPDLAMLASTSGSTGSPKLVRLSFENLRSNAAAIGEYLRITPRDRAATTLPLQYCYGLSVLNSYLLAGASVVLTEHSVSDERFWDEFTLTGATSFAGVPYTFELLDASGFAERDLPSLRYITQAGGRLAPDMVRRYARLGRERGFELVVMYGQTEATARMAYLPPDLAEAAAGSIGRAIPGGSLRVDVAAGEDSGELVYSGPNVMMGYAEHPADFATGRVITELRTGDLARQREDGLFEIVGRANRFVKVYGLRIDLDAVEQLLAEAGIDARTASADERLLLFVRSPGLVAVARGRAAAAIGVPIHAIDSFAIDEFPRTESGKSDTAALVRHAQAHRQSPDAPASAASLGDSIRDLYAELLGRPGATLDDSFAALGGDSLSYVEVSIRLETMVGRLPTDWHALSPRELYARHDSEGAPSETGSRGAEPAASPSLTGRLRAWAGSISRVETSIALRAAAIVQIVFLHVEVLRFAGGSAVLLAVLGYNLARFQIVNLPGVKRSRRLLGVAVQIAIPAVLWSGFVAVVSGHYQPTTVLLVNSFLPRDAMWTYQWELWFIEVAVWTMLALAALFAVPAIDRRERRTPFGFALVLLALAGVTRYLLTDVAVNELDRYTLATAAWFVMLGWAGARAPTWRGRLLVSAIAVAATPVFAALDMWDLVGCLGLLVLLWVPWVPVPRPLVGAVWALAGASLFIYLVHWQVIFRVEPPVAGALAGIAVGIAAWLAYRFVMARLGVWRRRYSTRGQDGTRARGDWLVEDAAER
ncbi:AMP-binding protein [Demequina aestuarii]|uniref:AMP-binding protein n=1 Tax=Demequina aestuarii TaxID=327095 RepID=UPI000780FBC9|nr:AMP-binding protein [Demequina aestuarii]